MKIIGIKEKKGEYQGNAYHNYNVCTTTEIKEDKSGDGFGFLANIQKVKKDVFEEYMASNGFTSLEDTMGENVRFLFDNYGNVAIMEAVEE